MMMSSSFLNHDVVLIDQKPGRHYEVTSSSVIKHQRRQHHHNKILRHHPHNQMMAPSSSSLGFCDVFMQTTVLSSWRWLHPHNLMLMLFSSRLSSSVMKEGSLISLSSWRRCCPHNLMMTSSSSKARIHWRDLIWFTDCAHTVTLSS